MTVFGGLVKQSLIDYPGRVAAVVFLSGCNLTCPYCHNPDLAGGKQDPELDTDRILPFLKKRRDFLDGVVISGGEPTLQDNLFEFCVRLADLGYPIKLDTNGTRPDVLSRLIREKLLDYVAMDIKTLPDRYGLLSRQPVAPESLLESIHLIKVSGLNYEFRTTCLRPFVSEEIFTGIGRLIEGARHYVLQRFRPGTVLDPKFFKKKDRLCHEADLTRFQSVLEPFVEQCTIR